MWNFLGFTFIFGALYGIFTSAEPGFTIGCAFAGIFAFGVHSLGKKENDQDAQFIKELEEDLSKYPDRLKRLEFWEERFRKNPPIWFQLNDEKCREERNIHKHHYKIIVGMLKSEKKEENK